MISPRGIVWRDLLSWALHMFVGAVLESLGIALARRLTERVIHQRTEDDVHTMVDPDAPSSEAGFAASMAPRMDWIAQCEHCVWVRHGLGCVDQAWEHTENTGHKVRVHASGSAIAGGGMDET